MESVRSMGIGYEKGKLSSHVSRGQQMKTGHEAILQPFDKRSESA
jgi:hypothetical protein